MDGWMVGRSTGRQVHRWIDRSIGRQIDKQIGRTTAHPHPHKIYIFFFEVAESSGPAFCTESGSFFSIWQSCICSSWQGNSASRLGGNLAQEFYSRFKILKMPFVYQTFRFIETTDSLWHYHIFIYVIYAVLAEQKTSLIDTVYMNVCFSI